MPIAQGDDFSYVSQLIRKEFAIIPKLTPKIFGSPIQSSNIISQCIRGQDVVTFDYENSSDNKEPEQYRQVIITPRYESDTTFIAFTTLNYQSMTKGDKIPVNVDKDTTNSIQKKILDMLKKNYASQFNKNKIQSMKILLYLPGGIPFFEGTIKDYIKSFPDYMPHFYAVLIQNSGIKENVLNQKFENICDISTETKKNLISPVFDNDLDGLCEMAAVLGYIQRNGENVMRMIYSIAKFCPFAPLICGLYNLACLSSPTGRDILQITTPLSILFLEMNQNSRDQTNLYSRTIDFLTYFMSINISSRVPCTEFIEPFYKIGYEDYFNNYIPNKLKDTIKSIVAFDPDFRDQDWIRFELPLLTDEDFENAKSVTRSLIVVPTMSLREMHRYALFLGKNGPCLFLAPSVSKDKSKRDTINYIDPENGNVVSDKYENIAKVMAKPVKRSTNVEYNVQNEDQIDPKTVKQFVFVCVDKSGSMSDSYYERISQFTAAQEFFIAFANHCYTFHTNSLYGSIMFESSIEVRNPLNSLVSDFIDKMIRKGERPTGCTAMFKAMLRAAQIMIEANKKNTYPNAVYRILVISDGYDNESDNNEVAYLTDLLIKNHIRVDAVIVTNSIEPRLVEITKATGGISLNPKNLQEGLDLFDKEEFFNVDIREFEPFSTKKYDASFFDECRRNRRSYTVLNSEIKLKQNMFADNNQVLVKPATAVNADKEKTNLIMQGKLNTAKSHPATKKIITELKKIIHDPDPDIIVYPLKDRIDVWRVLIKGPEGSVYEGRWYYLIIEFPENYPEHYPMIRFVKPPYHPNITDQGRICMDHLDVAYNSDFEIRGLIGEVKLLFIQPNFKDPVDSKRFSLDSDMDSFQAKAREWNDRNSKASADDWISSWKIEKGDDKIDEEDLGKASVPDHYKCPITHKIMEEPVIATTKVHYEKKALEKYLSEPGEHLCYVTGKPLGVDENMNLPLDMKMMNNITEWKLNNNYVEDQDDNDDGEEVAISAFRKKGKRINAKYQYSDKSAGSSSPPEDEADDFLYSNDVPKRPRSKLPDV